MRRSRTFGRIGAEIVGVGGFDFIGELRVLIRQKLRQFCDTGYETPK